MRIRSAPETEAGDRAEGPTRRVRIEKLAPTGEGIARTPEGVGFIDRALPGELVETSIYERRRRFWRGSLRGILERSPDRRESVHASCAGCDWAHFDEAAARGAKRELFLETMQRIGKLDPALFREASVATSEAGYRIRTRLHAAGRGAEARIGYFAPGSHRVVEAGVCEALSRRTRDLLPAVRDAIAAVPGGASEVAVLEDLAGARRLIRVTVSATPNAAEAEALGRRLSARFEGVRIRSTEGPVLREGGWRRLTMEVGGSRHRVSVDSFFQGNRSLVHALAEDVRRDAALVPPGEALDAFGGVGLFAGALLSGGHRVTSVESDPDVAADARATREDWDGRDRWAIEEASIGNFLRARESRFDVVVVDPPRAGLGAELAVELAKRSRRLFVYVSCDPATLARDLPAIRDAGFEIRRSRLYDLFAFTHRVEAVVALERTA